MCVRVDRYGYDASTCQLDRHVGQSLLRALEPRDNDDQWRRIVTCRRNRPEEVRDQPLSVLRRDLDALHPDIPTRRLNLRSAKTRQDDDRQQYPEQFVTRIIHVMLRKILFATFAACLISSAVAEDRFCQNDLFAIDARYDAGAFAKCKFKSDDMVQLTIKPEDRKVVVEQPWFSFKITSRAAATIRIKLRFPTAYSRYWPKISTDGVTWQRVADDAVTTSRNQKSMDLRVEVVPEGTWVSAQELITQSYYDTWLAELAAHEEITVATIGMSTEGRPIQLAKTANKPEVILLLGR